MDSTTTARPTTATEAAPPAAGGDPAAVRTAVQPAAGVEEPDRPRLADGVELLGLYEGSGFEEPPFLARRGDGQVVQLTPLLHQVAEACDGERGHAEVAAAVTEAAGRTVSADNIEFLVDRKLRPLGLLALRDGTTPELPKLDPLLGLKFRRALVPERAVRRAAGVLRGFFLPPVVVVSLLALVALDVWLLGFHGVAPGVRGALYEPSTLLILFAGVVLATAWHELGHAAACRYGGATPGKLGAGLYLVFPVFYCDVTDAYRLGRAGRLRTDLGGVYFNGLVALAAGAGFLATGFEPLLLLVLLQHLTALQQLMPVLRFDGYYVLSDLTGVPDILQRMKPILRSLLPGREPDEAVTELKPWARWTVRIYVLVLLPLLAAVLVFSVISAPRLFATAWDSLGGQVDRLGLYGERGDPFGIAGGALQVVALVLPCLGVALTLGRTGGKAALGTGRWASGSPPRMAVVGAVGAALLGLSAYTWWPNGDYRPIAEYEKGTVGSAVRAVRDLPSGRPSAPGPAPVPEDSRAAPAAADEPGGEPRGAERREAAADRRVERRREREQARRTEEETRTARDETPAAALENGAEEPGPPETPAGTGPTSAPAQPAPEQPAPSPGAAAPSGSPAPSSSSSGSSAPGSSSSGSSAPGSSSSGSSAPSSSSTGSPSPSSSADGESPVQP